jgi:hypothetical protein
LPSTADDPDERRVLLLAESLRRAIDAGRTDEEIGALARAVLDADDHEDRRRATDDADVLGTD